MTTNPLTSQPNPQVPSATGGAMSPVSQGVLQALLGALERLTRRGLHYYRKMIPLDGLTFIDCSFLNCHFVTKTGTFTLQNCLIQGPDTVFEYQGPAFKVTRLY